MIQSLFLFETDNPLKVRGRRTKLEPEKKLSYSLAEFLITSLQDEVNPVSVLISNRHPLNARGPRTSL